MNSCILMAEIIQAPELRYTSENQTPIAEMLVQFPGSRPEDPPATLKVVGWGNLAQEIQEKYRLGDRVIIEGRLGMNTIDRPEGFKEKRAELTAQRIHPVGADTPLESPVVAASSNSASQSFTARSNPSSTPTVKSTGATFQPQPAPVAEPDFDDIPF
ncbi:single-stranded DNA-binding protein [Leptothermofonsia sichuanensis E412]|uniref:single-stranded DNA-binding protein n=1 Tax=Leptothermofonsia sichuanensis TaxID=2917832 RepID=UPI001CA6AB67|nr:single-stranded DNA-binding protein [Leptothermofonsia sichuanensis]QZZ20041.1 single-stranded DNA-binding protein [Leptothermofonsia sichuanensis E412]